MIETGYGPLLLLGLATLIWLWTRRLNPHSFIPSAFFITYQMYVGIGCVAASLPVDVASSVFLSNLYGQHHAALTIGYVSQVFCIAFLLPWMVTKHRQLVGFPATGRLPFTRAPGELSSDIRWIQTAVLLQAGLQAVLIARFGVPLLAPDFEAARGYMLNNGGWKLIIPNFLVIAPACLTYAALLKDWLTNDFERAPTLPKKRALRKLRFLVLCSFVLYGLMGFAIGFRTFFVFALLIVMWSSLAFGRTRIIKLAMAGFAFFAAVFIGFSYLKFRELDVEDAGMAFIVAKALNRVMFQGFGAMSVTYDLIRQDGLYWGKTFWMQVGTYLPIERSITFGGLLGREAGYEEGFTLTPTIAAEAYANFLWGGVFIMLLLGWAVKRCCIWYGDYRDSSAVLWHLSVILIMCSTIAELVTIDTGAFIIMALRLILIAIVINVCFSTEPKWSTTQTASAR